MKTQLLTIIFCCFEFFGFSQTVELQSFGPNFSSPVEIVNAGDSRLFIVEKAGVIKILNANGTVNPTPFLNISTLVGSGGERGLLGLAFAPDYATSGRFYVNYTDNTSISEPNSIIARYTVSANPDIANTTETILLTIKQPFENHNGGKLAFGQDNFLYIGTGDGGSGGDPGDRAQNTSSFLGKLLRIDVSGSTYSIPSSNPFSSSANGQNDPRPEIFAIGLRNPWKFSFDTSNGDLWIADVGQNAYEEINKVTGSGTPGDNYGWRCYEGNNHVYNSSGNCPSNFNETIAPVAEYAHVGSGCSGSVTGGFVYRGNMFPNFNGKYFFADYCSQQIGILTDTGSSWSMAMQTPNITGGWTSLGEDYNGELYIAGGSNVYKIIDPNLSVDEHSGFHFKIYPNPANRSFSIDLSSKFNTVESISIYNIHGQKIKTLSKSNKQILNISTKNYHSGLYFVEICTNKASKIVKKLIIN
ncbi:PQQ-dependent sugar dehydrogenase [Hwangdonia lutea]|uniref:PQQ-dependent sugar dehydrogenase n=1 Tax=Hwangdonia lutea TaxID=3075823 RepID=A0AA97HQI1_9FLAO|nr:PQQ-dependent sugar dehydrogenase [Hwangdonia sp. SCSIO 19198]WOD43667.1 PQQ-dependent sugar dehydrogenase [Hwangdonia sp. SCSIO 19198]